MNKHCSRCGRDLPATLEFFGLCSEVRSGLRSQCRECVRAKLNAWRAAHPARVRELQQGYHRRAKQRRFEQRLEGVNSG